MAELTPEYIERMEDVLHLYEKPRDPKEPAICLDEKSIRLLEDARPVKPSSPGRIRKQDSEYARRGTGNIFCGAEPQAGRHLTWVTRNGKANAFAKIIGRIARAYPRLKTRHPVMDNLNTHKEKSPIDYYGPGKGRKPRKSFTVHYTPKHGSWLNQAEIEIGLLSRQCLGKDRIASLKELMRRVKTWNRKANRRRVKINRAFTAVKARKTFNYYKDKN
ncbi:MAG: IS630 family transposase [Nitrospinae bacterium]|nr:IS630 family transposase [Nitrospinota bacterium]